MNGFPTAHLKTVRVFCMMKIIKCNAGAAETVGMGCMLRMMHVIYYCLRQSDVRELRV